MYVQHFLERLRAKFATGHATEHSYRSALEQLFESIPGETLKALNEPKKVACGAPDLILMRGDIPLGHCEAKDLPVDLAHLTGANLDQKRRYLKALPNLVYTNGLDFEFYRAGERIRDICIGVLDNDVIEPLPQNFDALDQQLRAFAAERPQTIDTAKRLAEMMAGKAVLIKDIMSRTLRADSDFSSELGGQFKGFQRHLIHDISPDEFADIYAETIAYGMFAARLHDTSPEAFSREEALKLLPKTNPFLRNLFAYIAGPTLDDRIAWVVDDLADIFQAADVHGLMEQFGKFTARNDPFVHFYETFLAEYNPAKRKARGVWYTPEPVVNFIVRAVDGVLKQEFGLKDGLADTSKITIDWNTGQTDAKGKSATIRKQVHRVQILDPATGTGTFLAEAVKQIASKVRSAADSDSQWSAYVEQDLIPRLHGFELLMASYAMCHLKLDMVLTELGYKPSSIPPRLGVYLTNSLEEGEKVSQDLFAQWLANEAREASHIKRQMPIMCIIGNPPYSGVSQNRGEWITDLLDAYKKEPGGKQPLNERNPKWINDDYVKFIRLAEHLVERNGHGVVGFITNHGYLDNPTFRGLRWHLLRTFDKIYVLDLHGSSNKRELVPDDIADKNVFDIKTGVAIIICVKTPTQSGASDLARVFHSDLWGQRSVKSEFLFDNDLESIEWEELSLRQPHFMLVPWDYDTEDKFRMGFPLDELMPVYCNGIVTGKDAHFIAESEANLLALDPNRDSEKIKRISYRPFETDYVYYDVQLLERARAEVMNHYIRGDNIGLLVSKAFRDRQFAHAFVTTSPSEAIFLSGTTASNAMNMPLYLHPEPGTFQNSSVNMNPAILRKVERQLDSGALDERQLLDYIYGCLHSPNYRSKFRQALSIDFPHIPYPANSAVFIHVSEKGGELRRLHLMDADAIGETPFPFRGEGSGAVARPAFAEKSAGVGDVFINPVQCFTQVPRIAWDFFVGGYQPAQKWLKDRKGHRLSFDEVRHYQKIIKVLVETDRIMSEIRLPL